MFPSITITFKLTWSCWRTRERMLHFTKHCKDMLRERLAIFYVALFQIYWSICAPIIISL